MVSALSRNLVELLTISSNLLLPPVILMGMVTWIYFILEIILEFIKHIFIRMILPPL